MTGNRQWWLFMLALISATCYARTADVTDRTEITDRTAALRRSLLIHDMYHDMSMSMSFSMSMEHGQGKGKKSKKSKSKSKSPKGKGVEAPTSKSAKGKGAEVPKGKGKGAPPESPTGKGKGAPPTSPKGKGTSPKSSKKGKGKGKGKGETLAPEGKHFPAMMHIINHMMLMFFYFHRRYSLSIRNRGTYGTLGTVCPVSIGA